MSTPAGRSRRINESTVFAVGSMMSISRLWVRISKCSRESLSLCGERTTQYTLRSVGSGTGPETFAPVRVTVSTILRADWSMTSWSYAFSRIRIFCACAILLSALGAPVSDSLLVDLHDAAGAHRAAALADREAKTFVHRDRVDEVHRHRGVVAGHHHLDAIGELDGAGDVGRPEVE